MKRLITGIAVVALVAATAACGDDEKPAATGTSTVHVTVTEDPTGTGSGDGNTGGTGQATTSKDTGTAGPDTEVITVIAVGKDGQPRDGWTVSADAPAEVQCGDYAMPSRSATTPGLYECSPAAAGAHTCWPAVTTDTGLLCALRPWDKELRRYTANVPLAPIGKPEEPWAWALELEDGTRCTLRHGGAWGGRSDGLVGAFGCAGTNDVVLTEVGQNPVNTSSDRWTVRMGELGVNNEQFPAPTVLAVRKAWFAAAEQ